MGRKLILKNFRIVDELINILGSVLVEDGIIRDIVAGPGNTESDDFDVIPDKKLQNYILKADMVIDGGEGTDRWGLTLMPALVDLHAHFREPGNSEKETLESASLAAASGGYGSVVSMANTNPAIDTKEAAIALRKRCDALGLIDLFPAMSLSKGLEGKELSGIGSLPVAGAGEIVRLVSEDGKDVQDSALFSAALDQARRAGVVASIHAELGAEYGAARGEKPASPIPRRAALMRATRSRNEEIAGIKRAIEAGKTARCHIHIAHVSCRESVELIRTAKAEAARESGGREGVRGFVLTAEATPHHLCLTEKDSARLGAENQGLVNPPLRTEEDRQALIAGLADGTIDAIATDHAPHTRKDKEAGAPGFSGLETAFSACLTELVREDCISLPALVRLMSGSPARILGLADRGRIIPGYRADLFVVDTSAYWTADTARFKSRGKNSPFAGKSLRGKILATLHQGRPVFMSGDF